MLLDHPLLLHGRPAEVLGSPQPSRRFVSLDMQVNRAIGYGEMKRPAAIFFITLGLAFAARADVRPNSLFADNAVLQRGWAIDVFGTAREGEKVTVEFYGQKLSTTTTNGQWKVRLKRMKANPKKWPERHADPVKTK